MEVLLKYSKREIIYFLYNTKGISSISIKKLFDELDNIEVIFDIGDKELSYRTGLSHDKCLSIKNNLKNIEEISDSLNENCRKNKYITFYDCDFPEKLREIQNPPMGFFYRGSLPGNKKTVAIVGTRSPSAYGVNMSNYIAGELCKNNIEIISGMANGIDSISHKVCIESNIKTYAVLGSGIDVCYPKNNTVLYEKLSNEIYGGIISEYNVDEQPYRYNFPLRNRIISGLADAVVVIEAGCKSGTLITASYAAAQGKDVYVVPGRFGDKMSEGCNKLISDGAYIFTGMQDILYTLNFWGDNIDNLGTNIKLEKDLDIVYNTLNYGEMYIEDIIENSGLDYNIVINCLLELEIRGLIWQKNGNYYSRCI